MTDGERAICDLEIKVRGLESELKSAADALKLARDNHSLWLIILFNSVGTVIGIAVGLAALLKH
jgi:hypothetical protein